MSIGIRVASGESRIVKDSQIRIAPKLCQKKRVGVTIAGFM